MSLMILLAVAAVVAVALGAYGLAAARRRPVAVAASAPFDEADGIVSEPVPIERAAPRAAGSVPVVEVDSSALEAPAPLESAPLEPAPAAERASRERAPADERASAEEPAPSEAAPGEAVLGEAVPVAVAPAEMCWAKRFAPRSGALDDAARLGLIRDLGLVRAPWGVPLLVQAYDEEPDPAHRRAVLAALALFRHRDGRAVFERALRSADEGERSLAGAALADLGVTPSLPF